MAAAHLGPWEPLTVQAVLDRFALAPFCWWLAGGHALEAYLSTRGGVQRWRPHDDIDIGICRQDAPQLFDVLRGWDIHIAADGRLTPWDGNPLDSDESDRSGNNLWCRPTPDEPWALDVLIGPGNDSEWIYRPDASIRRPWSEAVLHAVDALPYLAPEIQLLFKSRAIRPKDALDAATVIPALEPGRASWLAAHLASDHPWQIVIAKIRS